MLSHILIKVLALYSLLFLSFLGFVTLADEENSVHDKAIIKMGLSLAIVWCVIGGTLLYTSRNLLQKAYRAIPLHWQLKFILGCTLFALLEEVITVTLTNMAPLFGSEMGKAFITASPNYLHTVLFHSVIVFIPMFIVLSFILRSFDLPVEHVFLLFGLIGSIAETTQGQAAIGAGFWFFVYGLMVFIPAYALPKRNAKPPKWWVYPMTVFLVIISPILLFPFTPVLQFLWDVMDPVFYVDSVWD
ncbi:hypothetical protein H6504_05440 [Candidatus Woesearchaeota archaeon]|nr:hypothetical protein [Candidatus Woesearchaeota archaeon]